MNDPELSEAMVKKDKNAIEGLRWLDRYYMGRISVERLELELELLGLIKD